MMHGIVCNYTSRIERFVAVLVGIVALATILSLDLPSALGAVNLMVPRTGAVEFDLGTALITATALLALVGVVEAARPRARQS